MSRRFIEEAISALKILILSYVIMLLLTTFFFKPVVVEGESMYPTLHNNDFGVAKILKPTQEVEKGDIVTLNLKSDNRYIVKRVIALEGDKVYSKDDIVYVNDQPINEDYLDLDYLNNWRFMYERNFTEDFDPVIVPEGKVFLLGDNRPNSRDSRSDGAYYLEDILSSGIFILYPFLNAGAKV